VYDQKQKDFFAVFIKVSTGDIPTEKARVLVDKFRGYIADEIRITQNQGLLLKFVRQEYLPYIHQVLDSLDLASPGFDSVADITTCPGTDTCNLGISNSTEMARVLENLINTEYEELIFDRNIKIKISGCMNSCGQHSLAHIGFHGSSLKAGASVVPAAQIMLGGGSLGDGLGRVSERVIKIPSKRVTQALSLLLDDYHENSQEDELFNDYYDRQTKNYFYLLLKPLADLTTLVEEEFIDWGHEKIYKPEIGVGECAGVIIDLVATLIYEAEEKLEWAHESYELKRYADAIYHTYSVFISGAKALLLDKGVNKGTHIGIIEAFDEEFVKTKEIVLSESFDALIMQINKNEPSAQFAQAYLAAAIDFQALIVKYKESISV
jgi:sulfite reductase (ferredoxin)